MKKNEDMVVSDTNKKERFELKVDQPIKGKEHDLLNMHEHAKYIANLLLQLDYSQSFVASIEGPWGSGKTSFWNLVKEEIESSKQKVNIIEFNPWVYKNATETYDAFCREIIELNKCKIKKLCDKFLILIINNRLIAIVLLTIVLFLLNCFFGLKNIIKYALLPAAASAFIAILTYLEDKLNEFFSIDQYSKVKEKAKKISRKKRFFIFIDDLDRIDKQSICKLFALINRGLENSNTVFVLAFDRNYMLKLLKDYPNSDQYLEKIIQIRYELQEFDKDDLRILLKKQFERVLRVHLSDFSDEGDVENQLERYAGNMEAVIDIFIKLLKTPRQVTLINNEITLRSLILSEVNPFDFMILSFINVIDTDTFEKIKKDALSDSMPKAEFIMLDPTSKRIDLKEYHVEGNTHLNNLIDLLFKNRDIFEILGPNNSISAYKSLMFGFEDNTTRKRYFTLRIKHNEISRVELLNLFDPEKTDAINNVKNKYIFVKNLDKVLDFFNYFYRLSNIYEKFSQNILIQIIKASYDNFCQQKFFYDYRGMQDIFKQILFYKNLYSKEYETVLFEQIRDIRFYLMINIYIRIFTGSRQWDNNNYESINNWLNAKMPIYLKEFKSIFEKGYTEFDLYIAYFLHFGGRSEYSEYTEYYNSFFREQMRKENNLRLLIKDLDEKPSSDIIEQFIFNFSYDQYLFGVFGNDDRSQFYEDLENLANKTENLADKNAIARYIDEVKQATGNKK